MNRISFSEWLLFQAGYKSEFDLGLLPEVFGADAILGHEPKDAKWEPPLNTDSNSYHYYFNVPGDDCGTKDSPCYDARMSLNSNKEASLSFYSLPDFLQARLNDSNVLCLPLLRFCPSANRLSCMLRRR